MKAPPGQAVSYHLVRQLTFVLTSAWLLLAAAQAEKIPSKLDTFLQDHCYECHDSWTDKGGLDLESTSFELDNPKTRALWIKLHDRVKKGEMPPPKKPRPEKELTDGALGELSHALVSADLAERKSQPGRTQIRRLNATEFANTLDFLFGPAETPALLPEETPPTAFDTEADLLTTSDAVIKRFLQAAFLASDAAVDRLFTGKKPETISLTGSDLLRRNDTNRFALALKENSLVLIYKGESGFNTSMTHSWSAPRAGWYQVKVDAQAYQTNEQVPFRIRVGDVKEHIAMRHAGYGDVGPDGRGNTQFWVRLNRSEGIRFTRPKGGYSIFRHAKVDLKTWEKDALQINGLTISGPHPNSASQPTPALDLTFSKSETTPKSLPEIETILRNFAPVALRQKASDVDLTTALETLRSTFKENQNPAAALKQGLRTLILDPHFLLRVEGSGQLSDLEVATRISFALTTTPPDAHLHKLATQNKLTQKPETLAAEIERLLKSPRGDLFIERLADQWFGLRKMNETTPDIRLYPEWNTYLHYSAIEETQRYLADFFRTNRPITALVSSDYALLNHRLAKHYKLAGPKGHRFERVPVNPDGHRSGLWTQASIMKITANGTSTSPILRGIWVLESLLHDPPPPPPANVKAVEPDIRGATTIREQLELHKVGSCASCHRKIDPWGFALENFGPAGGYRKHYRILRDPKKAIGKVKYKSGLKIDTSGELVDGTPFNDIRTVRTYLTKHPEHLAEAAIHRLVTYITGEEPSFSDRREIHEILHQIEPDGYRALDLLKATIASPLVLQR